MGSPQCASIIEFFSGKQPQQQPQDPQPPQGLHPELGLIQRSAPAISNPRIPASLLVANVKPVPPIKNIAPMILLQFFELGLQLFFIISPKIHHITIIDYLISICQYIETYRRNRSLDRGTQSGNQSSTKCRRNPDYGLSASIQATISTILVYDSL